jgi:hypothetical protein
MNNEHYKRLPAGEYQVIVETATLMRALTQEPMIEYLFRILNGDHQGQLGRSQQIITKETYGRVMNNLRENPSLTKSSGEADLDTRLFALRFK